MFARRVRSPASPQCATNKDYTDIVCLQHRQVGEPREMLRCQAARGFADVAEDACEQLHADQFGAPPDPSPEGHDRKVQLTLALMSHIVPNWTDIDCSKALGRAFAIENPDAYTEMLVETDNLYDVVTATEARQVDQYARKHEIIQKVKELKKESRAALIPKHIKNITPKPKAKGKAKAKPPRWLPQADDRVPKVTEHIRKNVPYSIAVEEDAYNGRWRVLSDQGDWRSISWTKRGFTAAAAEAIWQGWVYHEDYYGVPCPYSLDGLRDQFTAEAIA